MAIPTPILIILLQLAGLGQLVLAAASLAIPHVLGWQRRLASLDPFMKRIFWVYGGYILGTNIALGLICLWGAGALAAGGTLALAVSLYAVVYWGARIVIQFALFQVEKPVGLKFRLAEIALLSLFIYLVFVYGLTAIHGVQG